MGIIHMNGRVYDPLTGRFMSADPFIQAPGNLQSYNRYAYVMNNPLNLTDPSGYSWWTRLRDKVIKPIAIAYIGYLTGGAISQAFQMGGLLGGSGGTIFATGNAALTTLGGAIAGAGGGFVAGALSNGTLQGGLQGAFTGGVFGGIGATGAGSGWSSSAFVAAHAAGGCITSVAGGGSCGSGAASAAFGKFTTLQTQDWGFGIAQGAAAAVAGGVGSVIAGGKFENGATTAAYGYLFNAGLSRFVAQGLVALGSAAATQWDNIKTGWNALTKGLGNVMMSEGVADGEGVKNDALPKPPMGPGSVPKDERDPKRFFDPEEREQERAEQNHKCGNNCGATINGSNSAGHHIDRHADGGRTVPQNHSEVCINCHRDLHSGGNR
jgi:hypothetical protein